MLTVLRASSLMAEVMMICAGITPQLQFAAPEGGARPPSGHSNSKSYKKIEIKSDSEHKKDCGCFLVKKYKSHQGILLQISLKSVCYIVGWPT